MSFAVPLKRQKNRPARHQSHIVSSKSKKPRPVPQAEEQGAVSDETIVTKSDCPSGVLLNTSKKPTLIAVDRFFEDPGLVELLDFAVDFNLARKANVGQINAVGFGDAEQLVLEFLDV